MYGWCSSSNVLVVLETCDSARGRSPSFVTAYSQPISRSIGWERKGEKPEIMYLVPPEMEKKKRERERYSIMRFRFGGVHCAHDQNGLIGTPSWYVPIAGSARLHRKFDTKLIDNSEQHWRG